MKTLIAVILISILGSPSGRCANDNDEAMEVISLPASETGFIGGEFVAGGEELGCVTRTPPLSTFAYYFFPDGIVIKSTRDTNGFEYINRMGIWFVSGERVRCFYSPESDWRTPSESLYLVRIVNAGQPVGTALLETEEERGQTDAISLLSRAHFARRSAKELETAKPELIRTWRSRIKEFLDCGRPAATRSSP